MSVVPLCPVWLPGFFFFPCAPLFYFLPGTLRLSSLFLVVCRSFALIFLDATGLCDLETTICGKFSLVHFLFAGLLEFVWVTFCSQKLMYYFGIHLSWEGFLEGLVLIGNFILVTVTHGRRWLEVPSSLRGRVGRGDSPCCYWFIFSSIIHCLQTRSLGSPWPGWVTPCFRLWKKCLMLRKSSTDHVENRFLLFSHFSTFSPLNPRKAYNHFIGLFTCLAFVSPQKEGRFPPNWCLLCRFLSYP